MLQPVYSDNYRDILADLKRIAETCTGDIIDAAKARYDVIVKLCDPAAAAQGTRRKRSTRLSGN